MPTSSCLIVVSCWARVELLDVSGMIVHDLSMSRPACVLEPVRTAAVRFAAVRLDLFATCVCLSYDCEMLVVVH